MCISWTINGLIPLMHGITTKIADVLFTIYTLCPSTVSVWDLKYILVDSVREVLRPWVEGWKVRSQVHGLVLLSRRENVFSGF